MIGICEEVIYRGFLFAYFAAWMPEAPALVVIVLAALVFGLVHLYQGAAGVVKITIIGILFGTLYWMTGSVWPLMALHVVVDVSSGWMGWKFVQEGDFDQPATPVAA